MRVRVKPGPRPQLGRVDLPANADDGEYLVEGMRVKVTTIGRFNRPCLVFPLKDLRVGDDVEVQPVLRCRMCGREATSLLNRLCDNCYDFLYSGDAPLLAVPLRAAGEGEDDRPQGRGGAIR